MGAGLSLTSGIGANLITTIKTVGVDKDGILLMETFREDYDQPYTLGWLKTNTIEAPLPSG